MWTLSFQVSWCLCGVPGPDPIAKAAGSSPAPAALVESTDPAWPQAPGKSRVVSKRARGLRPSRNMPANQNSPGPSLALTAGGRDNSCEVRRRKRRPGAGIHSEEKIVSLYFNLYDFFTRQDNPPPHFYWSFISLV